MAIILLNKTLRQLFRASKQGIVRKSQEIVS